MSVKNVKAFFDKVAEDKKLYTNVVEVNKKAQSKEAISELVKIASAGGFKFTPEEFTKAWTPKQKISERESEALESGSTKKADCWGGVGCWHCARRASH